MLEIILVINFLGMIILPLIAGFYFSRKFDLSWKIYLAGGLMFIASQALHIPLVLALTSTFQSWEIPAYAAILGLLAGIFEETARYILFKFILKKSNTWNDSVYVGIGHGGTEAVIFGVLAALTFVNMLAYRNVDLSTVPGIPPEQIELAKQQVDAYWSIPPYLAILGFAERIFAMCLHVSLSVMVLYGLRSANPVWYWFAVMWHAVVDGLAVYLGQSFDPLVVEGVIAVCAVISIMITMWMKSKFEALNLSAEDQLGGQGQGRSEAE